MKKTKLHFKEMSTESDWKEAYVVMKQLRTELDEYTYLQLVKSANEKEGYTLVALYDENEIKAVTGFKPSITLYSGHSVWVCDLVTDDKNRSNGYGKKLLTYVHQWADENGYDNVRLSSGLQRIDAHRFYEEKMGYEKTSFHFKKRV